VKQQQERKENRYNFYGLNLCSDPWLLSGFRNNLTGLLIAD
jgi:hypothetical protein